MTGTWALYACLAVGPMSVLSPGVAAIYAVLPAIVGIVLGERFPPTSLYPLGTVLLAITILRGRLNVVQVIGIVLAIAGVIVLTIVTHSTPL